jgi:hypothetical protein
MSKDEKRDLSRQDPARVGRNETKRNTCRTLVVWCQIVCFIAQLHFGKEMANSRIHVDCSGATV